MSEINLSTLNKRELRHLLDTSRERGQADAAYRILQEMASRRGDAPPTAARSPNRPAEPRVIEVDLGDPMDRPDIPPLPNWRPPQGAQWKPLSEARAAPVDQPKPDAGGASARAAKPQPKPVDADPDPYADWTDAAVSEADFPPLRIEPPAMPPPAPAPRRKTGHGRRIQVCATFAVGFALGIGAGRELGDISHLPGATATPVAARAVTPPAPAPQPAAPAPDEPRAVVAAATIGPTSAGFVGEPDALPNYDLPAPPPEIITPPPHATVETARQREEREVAPVQAKKAVLKKSEAANAEARSCARERTPADRSICGDARLQRLQRELREAYAEALKAHDNRTLLRQRQLAWASNRDDITQPDRLARLYQDRIRKLNASTEAARRQ